VDPWLLSFYLGILSIVLGGERELVQKFSELSPCGNLELLLVWERLVPHPLNQEC
jgi:hypothetical protein